MSLIAARNTLRHQLARPLCIKRNMSAVDTAGAAKAAAERVSTYEELGMLIPEVAALQFYLLQHAMSDVRQQFGPDESLGNVLKIVEMYHELGVDLGQRMFVYLLLICTREARHTTGSPTFHAKLKNKFGLTFTTFMEEIAHTNSNVAVHKFLKNPPAMPLGKYCAGLAYMFNHGQFSGGYGGELWGTIAETLKWFVDGQISVEMLLDTAFTLAHNGGPIFNKGMTFHTYDGTKLLLVLNTQATGQIPQFIDSIGDYPMIGGLVNDETRSMYKTCRELLGDSFGGQIDWFKVDDQELATGYVYQQLKEKQIELFGVPGWVAKSEIEKLEVATAAKAEAAAKNEAAIKKNAEVKAIFDGAHFTVGIGGPLAKSERKNVKKI
jgi:hypothetical protein